VAYHAPGHAIEKQRYKHQETNDAVEQLNTEQGHPFHANDAT
jgi:hypothetical protein